MIDGEFCFNDVKRYVEENYPGYKCIDSSKNIYKATHIYFENGNQFFP